MKWTLLYLIFHLIKKTFSVENKILESKYPVSAAKYELQPRALNPDLKREIPGSCSEILSELKG